MTRKAPQILLLPTLAPLFTSVASALGPVNAKGRDRVAIQGSPEAGTVVGGATR